LQSFVPANADVADGMLSTGNSARLGGKTLFETTIAFILQVLAAKNCAELSLEYADVHREHAQNVGLL